MRLAPQFVAQTVALGDMRGKSRILLLRARRQCGDLLRLEPRSLQQKVMRLDKLPIVRGHGSDVIALALGVFVVYMVLYQISGNVLGPLVMGRAVQLHPLVILLATMVGTVLGGVVGLLLSVPAAAVLKVIWHFFYLRLAPRWGLEPSRDHVVSAMPPDRDPDPVPSSHRRD